MYPSVMFRVGKVPLQIVCVLLDRVTLSFGCPSIGVNWK